MNSKFLIAFGIGLGVYLLVLGLIALVKKIKAYRQVKKEEEQFKD